MSEELPEPPHANGWRHSNVRPPPDEAGRSGRDQDDSGPRGQDETLPPAHPDDRSPADAHEWQDDWDRARWAP
ncbi:hypothetical protein [Nocardia sp. NPDC046763]|uniref:hypothetical protein n=1 Tax=Nocardia sp. NPDC046763 TaxID=3155256 RepID=UPI00340A8D03